MVKLETPQCDSGETAPEFDLPGVDGQRWTLEKCRGENGLLVMFICNHCPYVRAVLKKIVRDCRDLRLLGVNSVAIMSNDTDAYPEDSFDNMRRLSAEYRFPFPYLLDEPQQVAKAYGAVCTPDFFGYNAELELQYRGRLDASGATADDDGQPRELYNAMRQVAGTGRGPEDQLPSIGCSIKWR